MVADLVRAARPLPARDAPAEIFALPLRTRGGGMSTRNKAATLRRLTPLSPSFRARAFTDAGGKKRFGISVSLNGDRFIGSVLVRNDSRVDAGGVAALLESMAAFVRRG